MIESLYNIKLIREPLIIKSNLYYKKWKNTMRMQNKNGLSGHESKNGSSSGNKFNTHQTILSHGRR